MRKQDNESTRETRAAFLGSLDALKKKLATLPVSEDLNEETQTEENPDAC